MAFTRINLNPPIDAGVTCRHCGQQLVAIALLDDGLYRSCDWRHKTGLKVTCRPVMTAAPAGGSGAVTLVEMHFAVRATAADALDAALADPPGGAG